MKRRKAIVTGASRGIGKGIALCLAKAGYDLAISYYSKEEEAIETAKAVREAGGRCRYYQASLEQPGEGDRFFDEAVDGLGGLDLLVNNAGITVFQSILDMDMEETMRLVSLDFLNYLFLAKRAARYMAERGIKGSIIHITSSRGERAYPEDAVYGGIKAGINRASKSMALDLAPYGIRVNCVAPGAVCIRTPEELERENRTSMYGFWEQLGPRIPLGRNGTPEDIGNMVVFLASDQAAYVTGEVIRIDGGLILPGMPEAVREVENGWGQAQRKE